MSKRLLRLCTIGTVIWMMCLFLPVSAVVAASDDTVKVGMRYDISTVNMIEMKLGSDIPAILLMHEPLILPDRR